MCLHVILTPLTYICNGILNCPLTFLHQKAWCSGSQDHLPWLRSNPICSLAVVGWNTSVGTFANRRCLACDIKSVILNFR